MKILYGVALLLFQSILLILLHLSESDGKQFIFFLFNIASFIYIISEARRLIK